MSESTFIRNLFTKCQVHGNGDAQVKISNSEIYLLVCLAVNDLNWEVDDLDLSIIPNPDYYAIDLDWFENLEIEHANPDDIKLLLFQCVSINNDFALYIENLCALHRRRVKYKRILSTQPLPTMDQIGPRVLLEYGSCDFNLLSNWMTWRKWIYDIDNRSAQETGYLFEPILASSLGGESIGAKNSPVKRIDENGNPTNKGRQIDCLLADTNRAYELKLRVTIAASGQGRFSEELSFPSECQAAGYTPVLLVLDPTPSDRLTELSEKFLSCGGEFFQGEDAWSHMDEQAGDVMSIFIDKYIKPVISQLDDDIINDLKKIILEWSHDSIVISDETEKYHIRRSSNN